MEPKDVIDIQQLLSLYGHVADAVIAGAPPERLAEVFTPEAVFDGRAAPVGKLHRGLDEIAALFQRDSPPHPPSHQMTNPYIWEETGVVRALSKWMGINGRTGNLQCGGYADILTRHADGWRIQERVVTCNWWDGQPL